jgi:hypothetical protein
MSFITKLYCAAMAAFLSSEDVAGFAAYLMRPRGIGKPALPF